MLQPARLAFAADGTPFSEIYGDVYHSAAGALGQARHVFLGGNDLPRRWQGRDRFTILETGFGIGLNFLATWAAWRADPAACQRLHFVSLEKHPFTAADLVTLHAVCPELAPLAAELQQQWPLCVPGLHRLSFDAGRVTLTLGFGDAMALLPKLVLAFDAAYLDGFAPARNPELWTPGLFRELAWLARPQATLATWSVARDVRDALTASGFTVARRPGFADKRNMLCGQLADSETSLAGPATKNPERVVIVGAGLAGCSIAERLAARDIAVTLIERQPAPAMETSGNLAAALLPVLSLDDNRLSRLNRACYLHALARLPQLASRHSLRYAACGVLQVARDAVHAEKQRAILARNGFPAEYADWWTGDAATAHFGQTVADGGWWFPGGGWANPADVCRALLASQPAIDCRYETAVAGIERIGSEWCLNDVAGKEIVRAHHVVLASAVDTLQLAPAEHLPIRCFRGQVSHLPADPARPLPAVICREGYFTPAVDGLHALGASFQRSRETSLLVEDHHENSKRLHRMLPDWPLPNAASSLPGRVGFRPVSPDKAPMVGAVPATDSHAHGRDLSTVRRQPGLWLASGYGARGMVWSLLMAETLACQLCDEPLPIEADLAASIDPARFSRQPG